jgi:hypothetical protein
MGDQKEQIRQRIAIDLENARLWGMFLLPSIGLDLMLIFTDWFFSGNSTLKYAMASFLLIWILFVFYMRNESLFTANNRIKEL